MCVDFRRLQECKKSLEENLFILHPQLSLALLEIRAHCQSDYESKLMLAIEEGNTYTLDEFRDCHMGKMGLVSHPFMLLFLTCSTICISKFNILTYVYTQLILASINLH